MKHKKNQVQPPVPADGASASSSKKRKKRSKGNRTLTIIFYTVYFVMVAAILAGLLYANQRLEILLTEYENSHLSTRTEAVFQTHFADPDWEALYSRVGLSDTAYEDSASFTAYMETKTGGEALGMAYAGDDSGGHKFLLTRGEETLGWFTMVDHAAESAAFPDWQLGQIHLNHAYSKSVTIQKSKDVTVYVNGVALTDDHTVQVGTSLADDYLPMGIHGPRIYTQRLDGLMTEPTVTATGADGSEVEVVYDEQQDLYIVRTAENTIGDTEYRRVLDTAKIFALRMIEQATDQELARYFDRDSASYETIVSTEPWIEDWFFGSYQWGEESITGYCRYSDELFSVHVELPMFVTRTDGTVKEYKVNHSFFFQLQNKTWKCVTITDADIRQQTVFVRLTFKLDDSVIFTNLYAEDTASLIPPTVTAPQGQVFAGWFRQDVAADGSKNFVLVFAPTEDGTVTLPAGTRLEPMTLYALFNKTE